MPDETHGGTGGGEARADRPDLDALSRNMSEFVDSANAMMAASIRLQSLMLDQVRAMAEGMGAAGEAGHNDE